MWRRKFQMCRPLILVRKQILWYKTCSVMTQKQNLRVRRCYIEYLRVFIGKERIRRRKSLHPSHSVLFLSRETFHIKKMTVPLTHQRNHSVSVFQLCVVQRKWRNPNFHLKSHQKPMAIYHGIYKTKKTQVLSEISRYLWCQKRDNQNKWQL